MVPVDLRVDPVSSDPLEDPRTCGPGEDGLGPPTVDRTCTESRAKVGRWGSSFSTKPSTGTTSLDAHDRGSRGEDKRSFRGRGGPFPSQVH